MDPINRLTIFSGRVYGESIMISVLTPLYRESTQLGSASNVQGCTHENFRNEDRRRVEKGRTNSHLSWHRQPLHSSRDREEFFLI